jgi:hypothetical protein
MPLHPDRLRRLRTGAVVLGSVSAGIDLRGRRLQLPLRFGIELAELRPETFCRRSAAGRIRPGGRCAH